MTDVAMFRATGEDWGRPGLHQQRHAGRGEGSQGDGALLRGLSKILEKVIIFIISREVQIFKMIPSACSETAGWRMTTLCGGQEMRRGWVGDPALGWRARGRSRGGTSPSECGSSFTLVNLFVVFIHLRKETENRYKFFLKLLVRIHLTWAWMKLFIPRMETTETETLSCSKLKYNFGNMNDTKYDKTECKCL